MSNWIPCNYTEDAQLPRIGEVIKIPLTLNSINFKYGPNSDYVPSSTVASNSKSKDKGKKITSRSGPKQGGPDKGPSHLILVFTVRHGTKDNTIDIQYFPIASFTVVKGRSKDIWNPVKWMEAATELQRMHHIPVPASNWTPTRHPEAPILTFGSWENSRPAWVLMSLNSMTISGSDKWNRHSDGPVILDGGIESYSALYHYYSVVIPRYLEATATTPSTSTLPVNNPTVIRVTIPDYHDVWTSILPHSLYGKYLISNDNSSSEENQFSDEEEPDPILFWNFPGLSKKLQESEEKKRKATLLDAVSKWQNQCVAGGIKEFAVDGDHENGREVNAILEDVDTLEITPSEEACDEDRAENLE